MTKLLKTKLNCCRNNFAGNIPKEISSYASEEYNFFLLNYKTYFIIDIT